MSYVTIANAAAGRGDFMSQATVAISDAAEFIQLEDPGTPNHAERLAWSNRVLGSAEGASREAHRWRWPILRDVTLRTELETNIQIEIGVGPTNDSTVSNAVSAAIPTMAGYA